MGALDRPDSLLTVARRVVAAAREVDLGTNAAALAYYALVSLVPLVVLSTVVVTVIWGDAVAARLIDAVGQILSPSGTQLVRDAVTGAAGRWQASVGSVVVLIWGVLRFFRALDSAIADIYGTEAHVGSRVADGLVAMLGVGGAIAVVVSARLLAAAFETTAVGFPVVAVRVLVVALLLGPLYYILPDVQLSLRDVLPGTVLAAGGWELLRIAFDLYLLVGGTSLSGLLGAILLFVTWLFFGSAVVLVGALVNAVVAGYR
ncbi:YihY/virulence factor BrkB family protein [Haloarcula marina]|uniref:YihY/virulence factor BrkB family protein n=1 Tax=Haloarcula marina TaxID=2961574 RepID=UPI0020B88172|nr:YihY/virulence factor BrkB family protein [Halomicroarcula marina]